MTVTGRVDAPEKDGGPVEVLVDNLRSFGATRGAYARLGALHAEHDRVAGVWLTPLPDGLLGLLASPSEGRFVYSPVLTLALPGLVLAFVRRREPSMPTWRGRWSRPCWSSASTRSGGGGLLRAALPHRPAAVVAVFLVPAWERLTAFLPAKVALVVLLVLSVLVQVVGVFYYPSPRDVDWNTSPRSVSVAPERLWDWRDTQLLRLLRNGPRPLGFGSPG